MNNSNRARISPAARTICDQLSEGMGITGTAVIEIALRQLRNSLIEETGDFVKSKSEVVESTREAILNTLESAGTPLSPLEIAAKAQRTHGAVRTTLGRMKREGYVKQVEFGRYRSVGEYKNPLT